VFSEPIRVFSQESAGKRHTTLSGVESRFVGAVFSTTRCVPSRPRFSHDRRIRWTAYALAAACCCLTAAVTAASARDEQGKIDRQLPRILDVRQDHPKTPAAGRHHDLVVAKEGKLTIVMEFKGNETARLPPLTRSRGTSCDGDKDPDGTEREEEEEGDGDHHRADGQAISHRGEGGRKTVTTELKK